ncbi:unnamed protein product, partial [Prorocentrum cordatum]
MQMFKVSIRKVALGLECDFKAKASVAIKLIRAIERALLEEVSRRLSRFPDFGPRVANPCDLPRSLARKLAHLRQVAARLAKEHALDELRRSHEDLSSADAFKAQAARQRKRRLIHRLAPGRSCALAAVLKGNGEVTADVTDMAHALWEQRAKTFQDHRPLADVLNFRLDWVRLRTFQFERAIKNASNFAPGPDGAPFLAWMRCARCSASLLYAASKRIRGEGASGLAADEARMFNASLLCLLPKRPAGSLPSGE